MKRNLRPVMTFGITAFCGLLGWSAFWRAGEVQSRHQPERALQKVSSTTRSKTLRLQNHLAREKFRDGTTVEMFASSQPGEVILRFPSEETYANLLFALEGGGKTRLIARLDRFKAVRLGYDEWSDFSDLLAGENIIAYDSLPSVPPPTPLGKGYQDGLVGFGDGLLPWLGITSGNSQWGAGVKIAILDTGVVPHPALPGLSKSIAITPFPENLDETCGHGTAVASLIASHDPSAPGVAPAVEIISIRIADESGKTDSFALAAGILASIDAGAQIINISMGTTENNPLIEEAVLYAHRQEVLIVSASGNSEQSEASYPAAYPSVISVGAVDARGEHLEFSNYGTYLSITAPGHALNVASPGNRFARVSGTSASAPIVAGAIAAIMSNGHGITMSASQAAEIVMNYSNDAGIPGPDSEYGVGIIDMGRVMSRSIPGIVDAAITQQRILKSNDAAANDEIQVTVQNRGTTILVNTLVEITTPAGKRQFNATTLAPGGVQTFSMPIQLGRLPKNDPVQVTSTLDFAAMARDITPYNNRRSDTLYRR